MPLGMSDEALLGQAEAARLQRQFTAVATLFALNHGTVTTPLVYASSTLRTTAAYNGNAMLYVGTIVSSLFVGSGFVNTFGAKKSLLFAMGMYTIYVLLFGVSANLCTGDMTTAPSCDDEALQASIFILASILGGFGAGVMWTAQGAFFADYAQALAQETGETVEKKNAELGGWFAVLYLSFEVLSKLTATLLEKGFGWEPRDFFFGFAGVALATCAGLASIGMRQALGPSSKCTDKVALALQLFPDPKLWLLSLTNLTFGFAAAFLNGYVNQHYTQVQLDQGLIGFLAAITATTAALGSHFFGWLGAQVGKGPVVLIGSLCFCAIPLCVLLFDVSDWGYGLVAFYLLQGVGRAVYESTNKAVFADFFPENAPGAFANCIMQSSLSMAACFFLSQSLNVHVLAALILGFGVLTYPGFALAAKFR
jgi:MFS family permease